MIKYSFDSISCQETSGSQECFSGVEKKYQDPDMSKLTEDLFDCCSQKSQGVESRYENWKLDFQSIVFQQNIIKHIAGIGDKLKEVEGFWSEYEMKVESLLEKIGNSDKRKEVKGEFMSLKTSIIGSLATINFFKSQGFKVDYPSVEEDMKKKCDLKFYKLLENGEEEILAVQLKSMRLPRLNKEETKKITDKLILINDKKLENEKDKKDFNILKRYCALESKGNKKIIAPLFINMPISREVMIERGRYGIVKLVDDMGGINSVMQKTLKTKWEKEKSKIGIDKI